MKRFHLLALLAVLCLGLGALVSCGGKKSGLEGKVVDGKGQPIAGLKIVATQETPIKGYEHFEAVTGSDGSFRFKKLFPSSEYVLKPMSDKWTTKATLEIESGPEGETLLLPSPLVIKHAFSTTNGSLVVDLATGKTRFQVSEKGVIFDNQTGLEWFVGPDRITNCQMARSWVKNLDVAGGGWRMPGIAELAALYQEGVGKRNIDPAFKTTDWDVCSTSVRVFSLRAGHEDRSMWGDDGIGRAFAVRSRR